MLLNKYSVEEKDSKNNILIKTHKANKVPKLFSNNDKLSKFSSKIE